MPLRSKWLFYDHKWRGIVCNNICFTTIRREAGRIKREALSEVDELIFDILIPARRFLHKSEMKR
jgi:hypothetical protein